MNLRNFVRNRRNIAVSLLCLGAAICFAGIILPVGNLICWFGLAGGITGWIGVVIIARTPRVGNRQGEPDVN